MSNAAKHRKKAAEFEQLKQIDRAIASYVKAIEESEAAGEDVDVTLFNKVGDLALRQGRVPDAITYYERAVEHYATSGLFNNAIALCNKILRNAPGRANVYFTLGRICARKGLRGDATRNFLEYATRMQQDGRVDEGMRALAEVADLMPELTEVRALVEENAARAGIVLPRRRTPARPVEAVVDASAAPAQRDQKSQDLVFLDVEYGDATRRTPARAPRVPTPPAVPVVSGHVAPASPAAPPPTGGHAPHSPASDLVTLPPEVAGPVIDLPFLVVDYVPSFDGLDGAGRRVPPATSGGDEAHGTERAAAPAAILDLSSLESAPAGGADVDVTAETASKAPREGLPVNGAFEGTDIGSLEGVTAEELAVSSAGAGEEVATSSFAWIIPPEAVDSPVALADDMLEGFSDAANPRGIAEFVEIETPPFVGAQGGRRPTPIDSRLIELEPMELSSLPELDSAIAAGAAFVARSEAERAQRGDSEQLDSAGVPQQGVRPPFRLDPHDFILPGELPPLLLEDAFVDAGLAGFAVGVEASAGDAVPLAALAGYAEQADLLPTALDAAWDGVARDAGSAARLETGAEADGAHTAANDDGRPVLSTPVLPIAAVAVEAGNVAASRRDSLRAAVTRMPQNWLLRRRLAEALFEAGEREAALSELETAQQGLISAGELGAASDIADELVRVSPDLIPYHQKRVELAVRVKDAQRLREAYLDLADVLVRMGEDVKARAVYARVLEIDPHDDRARSALGAAAPPPPPPAPERSDDRFVDLAVWLRDDDEPVTTRMRMREPMVSGDEQADFDDLLRHFKEGVARSLGEDDFESHYDLGVAFKEMGLLDDAVAEFQTALRSRAHRLPAYEALGQCFVELGRHQVAATVLSRALHEPGLDDEQRVGVLYFLARSSEALQRLDEARSYYQRVYAIDIQFRDVAARLAALEPVSR
ncbi:MAG: tetratricopeptide repeat protein [Gemmatimonas sp.]|uniref:tetratricopeptide repeat protein n=1 Tax=Gemmatimonas sp. TaxID=1962908 RepID=UPI00391FAB92